MNDRIEHIIQYLNGELSNSERLVFEEELHNNETLAKEVAFQRGLHRFLDKRQPTLERDLSQLGDEFILNSTENKRSFSAWWVISILLTLTLILYFTFFNKKTPLSSDEDAKAIENTIETAPIERDKGNDILQENENKEIEKQITTDQPIAVIDKAIYQRNPTMESIIADNYRADDTDKMTVIIPKMDAIFAYQESIPFDIKGETNIKPSYRIIIYSNRNFDINNDYRVLDTLALDQKNNDNYQFNFSSKLSLKKGLYYLVIRKDGSRDVLHISRFTIE